MRRERFIVCLFSILIMVAGVTQALAVNTSPTTVELTAPLHFLTPAGDDIEVGPGIYEVEAVESWLKLIPEGQGRMEAVLIDATQGTHKEPLTKSEVRLEGEVEGEEEITEIFHLAMLLPDGTGLEAVGTASGIRPRGLNLAFVSKFRKARTFTARPNISLPRPEGQTELSLSPKPCDSEKIKKVKAKGNAENIDCQLTLEKAWTITKTLVFEGAKASRVTLDCRGATLGDGANKDMIEVRSRKYKNDPNGPWKWERPYNVTIKNCLIIGSVRVWGMSTNGQGEPNSNELKKSSRQPGHTKRVQANAPKNIVFDNVHITGVGRNPFYFAPGVTHSKLLNSELKGKSNAVGIYLDAESAWNVIKNNDIHILTKKKPFGSPVDRPLVALDGSSRNIIINNRFSNLSHGGIHLYRNCGEGGVVRHQTPSHNIIVNNIFYYNTYTGGIPAVYLGSRDWPPFPLKKYCGHDAGVGFGSSASDKDHARHNVVMQNQIHKRSIKDMIKTKNSKVNSPNYIDHNRTVTDQTVIKNQPAGCYLPNASQNFLLHGRSLDLLKDSGTATCLTQYFCTDGELSRSHASDCRVKTVVFNCQVSGNNKGCQKVVACPSGKKLVGAKAACNLESGTVSSEALQVVPPNLIKVLKASDKVSAGDCYIGFNKLHSGEKEIASIKGFPSVAVGCKEYDKNGGDCHIKGVLYCK